MVTVRGLGFRARGLGFRVRCGLLTAVIRRGTLNISRCRFNC